MTHFAKRDLAIGFDRLATPAHSISPGDDSLGEHIRVTFARGRNRSATRLARNLTWTLGWLVLVFSAVPAEQLPIKTYTTADGLAQDSVNRIIRDSRGFLWFCTREGLSRFDGYRFTTYTTDQGLPHRWVDYLLEARDGSYWVAAGHWICRFNLTGAPLFIPYAVPAAGQEFAEVHVLLEDPSGLVWCGTGRGLYLMDRSQDPPRFQLVDIGMPLEAEGGFVESLIVDHYGSLWCGTRGSGLYRRWPDGRVEHYKSGLPDLGVKALLEDNSGRLGAGTPHGLCRLVISPDPRRSIVDRVYTSRDGLATDWIDSLFESSDGTLWIGCGGLSELREFRESGDLREYTRLPRSERPPGNQESRNGGDIRREAFRTYTTGNGLSSSYMTAIAEDRDGNIWLGTDSGGAMKLVRSGFTAYTPADGLAAQGVDAVFEDRAGQLCCISSLGRHLINRFGGRRFMFVAADLPKKITKFGWGYNQITFQDRSGDWWVPTSQGLCRFPRVARVEQLATTPPKKVYTTRDGLPFDEVFRLYEDSRGDIWISTVSPGGNGLSRWRPDSGRIQTFLESDGLATLKEHEADAFCEDGARNLWIGLGGKGGLLRYSGGRFSHFTSSEGLPAAAIRSLYVDHVDRLWIATVAGLFRVDEPGASRPRFVAYTTGQGLSSGDVYCVTEDPFGRIYIGTGRGLDRLDPDSGYIKHYTADDGLMRGKVTSAFRDRHGALWFASNVHGLCRLVPRPDPQQTPPPILISGLRIAGVAQPVSQVGETEVGRLSLAPGQNQLNIDFVGLGFEPGEVLRYQYKLESVDREWSQPSDQRSVNYPNLAPGSYRFLVRAVNAEGLASEAPATVAFTIRPPVWRQWWFLCIAALMLGFAIYLVYSARVARLLELERVRTRIATDLHDDIGANLSLIAMVSEVARGHLRRDDENLKEWFSTIATTSRDTVDAMSDIVWAVNPRRDQLSDLIMRMRRLAEDFFAARNIDLSFNAPEPGRALKVGADVRREVFLIFKESINNLVRHSRSTLAEVDLTADRGWLVLKVKDNGRGFDPASTPEGNGLASMRQRAGKLGGSLDVLSNGHGTTVSLRVPLDHRGRFW
jgi:ligand-binding sensor domain-containing protein